MTSDADSDLGCNKTDLKLVKRKSEADHGATTPKASPAPGKEGDAAARG
ncbi:hypothetical protein [Sphingomonas morindae]|uniref:Uncharacterized protein n=1 Tax=Sphingomonas morindae TaxID=1541170 RepID=A0ABY4X6X8_9SPHN|nr:hypothetical protein [Sphingomonas morindae]USI72651.1 hypothetical protein LHA26_15430 [Sphingomonas morindae]